MIRPMKERGVIMRFCELLAQYMDTLNCTGKELAELSNISSSVISRYKTGERVPSPDSTIVASLARAISTIASSKQLDGMSEPEIMARFTDALLINYINYEDFVQKFNLLYSELNLSMKSIALYTNYDISFLYRIKSGERRVSDLCTFSDKIAEYLVHEFSDSENKEKIAALIGKNLHGLTTSSDYYNAIHKWLLENHRKNP